MQTPFHQKLTLAFVHQLDRLRSGCVAVRNVDHLETVYRNSALPGDLVDLGGRPHQKRFDDPKLGCLDGATKRSFVAGVHYNRLCWRYLLGFGDQTVIFRFWRMRRRTDGPKGPYFALSVSWHVDSM